MTKCNVDIVLACACNVDKMQGCVLCVVLLLLPLLLLLLRLLLQLLLVLAPCVLLCNNSSVFNKTNTLLSRAEAA